jgi:hypothetical protein
MQDSTELLIERMEYGWSVWFMAVGGLAYFWKKLLGFIVYAFTYPLMINTLLGRLFFMKNNRDDPLPEYDDGIDKVVLLKPAKKTEDDILEEQEARYRAKFHTPQSGLLEVKDKTFITRGQKEDYHELKLEVQTNKVSAKSMNRMLGHVVKNRSRFDAQITW